MKISTLPRLSDLNITDDIIRSYLYRDILHAIRNEQVSLIRYEIRPDEIFRPDLVSARVYQSIDATWLVMLVCDIELDSEPLPVATEVAFPPASFIRERIRHFSESGELE